MRIALRSLFFTACALVLAQAGLAQDAALARADLKQLRDRYEGAGAMQADVALEIQFPEQPAEVQRGTIVRDGERFRVAFDQQVVISDGTTLWMYLPDNREVQVYDATDGADGGGGGFMRPQDLLTIYDSDGFEAAVVGEVTEGGRAYRQIEFKPTDRDAEFAKVRMTYDPARREIRRVKVFNKDGSRFTLVLDDVRLGVPAPAGAFTFREADYPGVMVEDMRL